MHINMNIKRSLLRLCTLAVILTPVLAEAKTGKCVLQVNKKTYLNGPCPIKIDDDQGSFTIGVSDTHRSKYFAYVTMESDGAHGYWNEEPNANHAHSSLGILTRHGACWENETAKVCAYK